MDKESLRVFISVMLPWEPCILDKLHKPSDVLINFAGSAGMAPSNNTSNRVRFYSMELEASKIGQVIRRN